MKTLSSTILVLLAGTIASAQEAAPKSVTVSIGGGRSFSSSSVKQEALIGNGTQLGADVFVPLFRKGWDGSVKGSGKFALGVIAGGYYQSANNAGPDVSGLQSQYRLPGGSLDITNTQNGASHSKAIAFSAGLQANVTFGKVTLSPSVSGGYTSVTRDGFTQSTKVMVNGESRTVVLSSAQKAKGSGVIVIPQVKVAYQLSGSVSVYAAGSVNAGPSIKSTQNYLVPAGGFNDKHTYEPNQLVTGTMPLDGGSKDAGYFTTSIQAGVSFSFGRSKAKSKPKTTAGISGGGGAVSSSYAAGRAVKTDDNPKAGKQTQGSTFGEKVASGLHAAGSAVAQGASIVLSPGSPIGGIVVKGGKNPGGNMMTVTTDNNGEFELNITEAGDYQFTLTAPPATEPQGKSINEKGIKRSDNPLYKDKGQAGNNPLYQPGARVASPGNPIGGIIVKGGKNPGGSSMTITTNNNGVINLNGLTAGSYRFTVTAP